MNYKVRFGLIFLLVVSVGVAVMLSKEVKEDIAPVSSSPAIKEHDLINWVYGHSSKISYKTCDIIVENAILTKKPLLILAVVSVESEFSPTAISPKGAIGLGQIMWDVWGKDLIKAGICKEKRDLFDIDVNIKATNYVLDSCLKGGGGDIAKALSRYLGEDQSYYKNKITERLANLYLLSVSKVK